MSGAEAEPPDRSSSPASRAGGRLRREPPRFRRVEVRHVRRLSPRLARVTFAGPELAGLEIEHPAASVRLLLPGPESDELIIPTWEGNQFLLPNGRRPSIRTFTPRRLDSRTHQLDLDIVIHGGGVASGWAETARPGLAAAISGPGRGYVVDPAAPGLLLAGDETAIPAMSQLLEILPPTTPVEVLVEAAQPDARHALPEHPLASVTWHDLGPGAPAGDALVAAIAATSIPAGTRVWVAGEAAAVQRIRRHLFEDRGLSRSQATVRGYWKQGRSGDADDTAG